MLLLVYRAAAVEFRTAWFVESLLTELAVALVVRTRRPFFRSRPGRFLLWSTVATGAVAFALPYSPLAPSLGFTALPPVLVALIVAITVGYVAAAEALKRAFYRSEERVPPQPPAVPQDLARGELENRPEDQGGRWHVRDGPSNHAEPCRSAAAIALAAEDCRPLCGHAEPPRKPRQALSARTAVKLAAVVIVTAAAVAARDATHRAPTPRPCETALVTSGHVAGLLRAPGRLTVRTQVRVGSSHPGQVIAVDVAVGARVMKGQIIARLDDAEQRAAAVGAGSQLASAQLLGLRAEKAFFDILRSERDDGSLPELPDPDELLEGRAGDAQLELLHTETEIARRTAALSLARRLLARRVIRAPMDGIVLERSVEPGESIPASPPGPPLFVIGADPTTLRLEVEIDERYIGGVLPGPVTFTSPAHGAYTFSGTIREVDPRADRRAEPEAVPGRDRRRQPGWGLATRHVRLRRPSRRHRARRARRAERSAVVRGGNEARPGRG